MDFYFLVKIQDIFDIRLQESVICLILSNFLFPFSWIHSSNLSLSLVDFSIFWFVVKNSRHIWHQTARIWTCRYLVELCVTIFLNVFKNHSPCLTTWGFLVKIQDIFDIRLQECQSVISELESALNLHISHLWPCSDLFTTTDWE